MSLGVAIACFQQTAPGTLAIAAKLQQLLVLWKLVAILLVAVTATRARMGCRGVTARERWLAYVTCLRAATRGDAQGSQPIQRRQSLHSPNCDRLLGVPHSKVRGSP